MGWWQLHGLHPSMIYVLLFILGLVFGSFVSALSYRFPKKLSFVKGRSICPQCKKQIAWYDNIPLLSFILLGGKCRNCKKAISIRYPLIELTSGIGFVLIGINPVWLSIFVLLLTILVIDFENQIIPDEMVFLGIVVLSLYYLVIGTPLFPGLLAGFWSGLFLLFIHLVTRGKGMGLGDVKLALLGGLVVGTRLTFVWLLSSFLTGGLIAFILILVKGAKLKDRVAFGPFLIIGLAIAKMYGEKILFWLHLG